MLDFEAGSVPAPLRPIVESLVSAALLADRLRSSLSFRKAGESWTSQMFPVQLQVSLSTLAVAPRVRVAYLAGLSGDLNRYSGNLCSNDEDATWHPQPSGPPWTSDLYAIGLHGGRGRNR